MAWRRPIKPSRTSQRPRSPNASAHDHDATEGAVEPIEWQTCPVAVLVHSCPPLPRPIGPSAIWVGELPTKWIVAAKNPIVAKTAQLERLEAYAIPTKTKATADPARTIDLPDTDWMATVAVGEDGLF